MKKLILFIFMLGMAPFAYSQGITNVSPNAGNRGQTLPIIVSGQATNFTSQGSGTLVLSQGSFTISSGTVTFVNANQVDGIVTIPNNAPFGFYDLFVSQGSTHSKANSFLVKPGSNTHNLIIVPAGAQPNQTLNNVLITVPGAQFKNGQVAGISKVWLSINGEVINTVSNINVVNSTKFSADISIPLGAKTGVWNVNVLSNNGDVYVKSAGFLISTNFSVGEWGIPLNEFKLFPNPVVDYIHVEFDQDVRTDIGIRVIGLNGQFHEVTYDVNYDDKMIKANVETLPKGTYVMQLVYKDVVLSSKKWIRQ